MMNDGRRDWESLPNKVLINILSFLDAKEAVQSTLISKRWVNLWTSLPTLNFTCNDYTDVFAFEFVDKVLSLRDESSSIKSLTFWQYQAVDTQLLKRVLSYAFAHGVQHLTIFTPILEGDRLCWFSSTSTLLTLKLVVSNVTFRYPKKNNAIFGKLVTLNMECAMLESNDPFSGCPNLQNLTLINCLIDHKVLVLSGSRLLKLTIISYGVFRCDELVILSSRLTFIRIEGLQPLCISFRSKDGLPQFNEIYFDSSDTEGLSNEKKQKLHSYLTKMLRMLHKAKYVTVSTTTIELLAYDRDMLAQEEFPFCNLNSLTFASSNYRLHKTFKLPLYVMDYFIRSSPQAQVNVQFPSRRLYYDDQENRWN